jgi:hypothetical protein
MERPSGLVRAKIRSGQVDFRRPLRREDGPIGRIRPVLLLLPLPQLLLLLPRRLLPLPAISKGPGQGIDPRRPQQGAIPATSADRRTAPSLLPVEPSPLRRERERERERVL